LLGLGSRRFAFGSCPADASCKPRSGHIQAEGDTAQVAEEEEEEELVEERQAEEGKEEWAGGTLEVEE
jgi:hypothetical protein